MPPRREVSEEFVCRLNNFDLIENYFSSAPQKLSESIELCLEGRKITILGITEEESLEEFRKAFGQFLQPVVNTCELADVIDRFLEGEFIKEFKALYPSFPNRGMGWNLIKEDLNPEEVVLLQDEIDRFPSEIPFPGDLRDALTRLPTEKLKSALLSMAEPMITLNEIQLAQTAMKIRRLQKPFMQSVRPRLQPEALKSALENLPEEYKDHFRPLLRLIQKRIEVFETLIDDYTAIYTVEFVLGEELNQQILQNLPIQWRLPKEEVPRFRTLLEYQMIRVKGTDADSGPSGDVVLLGDDQALNAEKLLEEFQEVRDYYVHESLFPRILPFTNMPLHPWPRIERIKQAFRSYFPIESLLRAVNDEMIAYYEQIQRNLSPELRKQIEKELEVAQTTDEKLNVFKKFRFPEFPCTPAEQEAFAHVLTIFISQLREPVPADEDPYGLKAVTEKMQQYYEQIRRDLSIQKREALIEKVEKASTIADKTFVLKEFQLPDPNFSHQELATLLNFLPLLVNGFRDNSVLEPEEISVHDVLADIEADARKGLENTLIDLGVRVSFRQQGREVSMGFLREAPSDTRGRLEDMVETLEEVSEPDSPVLLDFDSIVNYP